METKRGNIFSPDFFILIIINVQWNEWVEKWAKQFFDQHLPLTGALWRLDWRARKCPNFKTVAKEIRARDLSNASPAFHRWATVLPAYIPLLLLVNDYGLNAMNRTKWFSSNLPSLSRCETHIFWTGVFVSRSLTADRGSTVCLFGLCREQISFASIWCWKIKETLTMSCNIYDICNTWIYFW